MQSFYCEHRRQETWRSNGVNHFLSTECCFSTQRRLSDDVVALDIDQDVTQGLSLVNLSGDKKIVVLCYHNIFLTLEGKFYNTTIRPMMLFRTECRAYRKYRIKNMEVTDMCMLRWIYGNTSRERLNE